MVLVDYSVQSFLLLLMLLSSSLFLLRRSSTPKRRGHFIDEFMWSTQQSFYNTLTFRMIVFFSPTFMVCHSNNIFMTKYPLPGARCISTKNVVTFFLICFNDSTYSEFTHRIFVCLLNWLVYGS